MANCASLVGARGIIDAGSPNGFRAAGWMLGEELRIHVGCHHGQVTLAQGREYWKNKEDRCEVIAALDYIEAVAKLRGWIK